MLVLTRKTNQSIMIGDDVEVSVLAVSRDKIRLGITAPRDVPVFRKEVYISIKEEEMWENQGASKHVDEVLATSPTRTDLPPRQGSELVRLLGAAASGSLAHQTKPASRTSRR